MNLKPFFSWTGLAIFALPLFADIAYAVFPPNGGAKQTAAIPPLD